jgi:ankyrin repeat protein
VQRLEIVEVLLGFGASPNVPDLKGRTPLHYAAQLGAVGDRRFP